MAQVISCGIKVLKSRVLFLLFVWLFDTLCIYKKSYISYKDILLDQVLQYLGKSSSHQSCFKTCVSRCSFMSIIHLE